MSSDLSSIMQKPLPRTYLLSGQCLLREFDPRGIGRGLDALRLDNFRFTIANRGFKTSHCHAAWPCLRPPIAGSRRSRDSIGGRWQYLRGGGVLRLVYWKSMEKGVAAHSKERTEVRRVEIERWKEWGEWGVEKRDDAKKVRWLRHFSLSNTWISSI